MSARKPSNQSVFDLSLQMGILLMQSGAEVYRIQETMERVVKACDVEECSFYVLSNAIFANGTERGKTHSTSIEYVRHPRTHIGRISAVNQLSREFVAKNISIEAAFDRLEEIRKIPYAQPPLSLICCGIACTCFCYILGGTLSDHICTFLCGFLLETLLFIMERFNLSRFMANLCASAFVAAIACISFLLSFCSNPDILITASIVRLVPGVVLTNSIRDFFNSDYLSGTNRMVEALVVGICLAIGVGFVIRLFSLMGATIWI